MTRADEKLEGYNGWKNYETWATVLWIGNESSTYEAAHEMANEAVDDAPEEDAVKSGIWSLADAPRYILADRLKAWVSDELLPDLGATLAADLLGAAVSEVDWNEIAAHYLAEVNVR